MIDILKVENYRIQAYSHQENGIVERANKEVIRHARNLAYDMRRTSNWDEDILKIQAILNEKTSEATGLSPNQILFVGQIDLRAERLYPNPTPQQRTTMSTYMKKQIQLQEELMEYAERNQEKRNELHLAGGEETEIVLNTGQYVVVKHENGIAPNKLAVRHHGPYRIIEVTRRPQGTIYTCYSPKDGKVRDFHSSVITQHPCRSDNEAVESAVKDDEKSYVIQNILHHNIVDNKLNLYIKWHGYKAPEWTGLDSTLRNNEAVQEYLEDHQLTRFGNKRPRETNSATEMQKKKVKWSSSV